MPASAASTRCGDLHAGQRQQRHAGGSERSRPRIARQQLGVMLLERLHVPLDLSGELAAASRAPLNRYATSRTQPLRHGQYLADHEGLGAHQGRVPAPDLAAAAVGACCSAGGRCSCSKWKRPRLASSAASLPAGIAGHRLRQWPAQAQAVRKQAKTWLASSHAAPLLATLRRHARMLRRRRALRRNEVCQGADKAV